MSKKLVNQNAGFGTGPVFFTAISTILGAILFLRFGYAVGHVGFFGTVAIIIVGHLVTIPTAMAIAEIATNQKVEGGGEYYIISRSFGLNIGAAIGIALFLSQAISVAFYVMAFAEAFEPVFNWVAQEYDMVLDKRAVSIPAMALLALLILTKGADLGVKALYIVVVVLFASLIMFFLGSTDYVAGDDLLTKSVDNPENFFTVFAICFPAFTGMTAGVGLSGDLKDPSKSIPFGTLAATLFGMVVYVFIAYKLTSSASPEDLATNQLIMGDIALWYPIVPIGLACATISSALGSIMVAPRTLQALASDNIVPLNNFNAFASKGKGKNNEPFNAALITIVIAFGIIAINNVDFVAELISMFFMVTYGSLCLISFLQHFAGDPSYRPAFRSRWYISLLGFIMCVWLMFKMNMTYAFLAVFIMVGLYIIITTYTRDRKGLAAVFQGVVFQVSRKLQIFLQKTDKSETNWRPSVVCVSESSFNRFHAFNMLRWISHKHGFGTYIHRINGYYSRDTSQEANGAMQRLIYLANESNVFLDTLISPSYTSAIAQVIQLPGVSGKDNNMILFEFAKWQPEDLDSILDNYGLVKSGDFDVCILASSQRNFGRKQSIHIWIKPEDYANANLMILLGYILIGHPEWKGAQIKIYAVYPTDEIEEQSIALRKLIATGRLPISRHNIEILASQEDKNIKTMINEYSCDAALTIIGFRTESMKDKSISMFEGYDKVGSILFVNSDEEKVI